jgi:hypothetical protein
MVKKNTPKKKENFIVGDIVYLKGENPPKKRKIDDFMVEDRKKYARCSYIDKAYSSLKSEKYLLSRLSHYPDDWEPFIYLG